MTGHHGWGYGQNDGRRRPWPAPMRWHSPPTLASCQVSRTRKSPTSRPEPDPPLLVQPTEPAHLPGPSPGSSAPGAKSSLRPSGHSRQLRCAASYAQPLKAALARTWARTFTHSPPAGRARGMEVAQGSGGGRGGALCAGASAGSAHRVCAGTCLEPGSAWARARVPGREFPRWVSELTCRQVRKGRGRLGVKVCVRLSEHIPVRSKGVSGPHQPPGLTRKSSSFLPQFP